MKIKVKVAVTMKVGIQVKVTVTVTMKVTVVFVSTLTVTFTLSLLLSPLRRAPPKPLLVYSREIGRIFEATGEGNLRDGLVTFTK